MPSIKKEVEIVIIGERIIGSAAQWLARKAREGSSYERRHVASEAFDISH